MPTINVTAQAGTNGSNFNPKSSTAPSGGGVTFTTPASQQDSVYTFQNNVLTTVFTSGAPPYSAPGSYTLKSGISGEILLSLSSTPPGLPQTPTNGTINVG